MPNRDLSKIETLLEKNNANNSHYLFFKNALRRRSAVCCISYKTYYIKLATPDT